MVSFWSKQKSEHSTAAAPGFPVTKWKALRPEIQAFFESEEGQWEFVEGKYGRNRTKRNRTNTQGGNISNDAPASAYV